MDSHMDIHEGKDTAYGETAPQIPKGEPAIWRINGSRSLALFRMWKTATAELVYVRHIRV